MIMHRGEQTLAIRALKSAAPYIRMYKGKTFVVKAGGGVFADTESTRVLLEQVAILHYFGVRVVMVHGGGPQTTEISEAAEDHQRAGVGAIAFRRLHGGLRAWRDNFRRGVWGVHAFSTA